MLSSQPVLSFASVEGYHGCAVLLTVRPLFPYNEPSATRAICVSSVRPFRSRYVAVKSLHRSGIPAKSGVQPRHGIACAIATEPAVMRKLRRYGFAAMVAAAHSARTDAHCGCPARSSVVGCCGSATSFDISRSSFCVVILQIVLAVFLIGVLRPVAVILPLRCLH